MPEAPIGLTEDFADRSAGDIARGLTDREKAAVKRHAGREARLTVITRNLSFVDIIEKVQFGFLLMMKCRRHHDGDRSAFGYANSRTGKARRMQSVEAAGRVVRLEPPING
ncbi:MAG: hypothetical protein EOP62_16825 [Sphingomonadales bacterium]|nr:MAG: hypothetical protein EOP62_16825 [Sphingomonadales bacterium]